MSKDFLVELGTEELPPKALKGLMEAFVLAVERNLQRVNLSHLALRGFATPRRLAVLVCSLDEQQPDTRAERLGPAVSAAFDDNGKPTPAALGFARGCGVTVEQLDTVDTDKGARLAFHSVEAGQATIKLLPAIVDQALTELPIDRRMRWGASRVEFVRPVHWVVMLFDGDVVPGTVMGIKAGNCSRGHRFHHPEPVFLNSPLEYLDTLRTAHVVADFVERREIIHHGIKQEATRLGGSPIIDDALLDEVAALTEWPVVLSGRFDRRFLAVPAAALVSSMKEHQKYFHVVDGEGQLLPVFITVANLDSNDAAQIIAGNEKVIRPRLADAAFFYETDLKTSLTQRRERLRDVIFQEKLGSLFDKTERVARLAEYLAAFTDANPALSSQAAQLSKSDLLTEMVQEFPDLQGTMGEHYARVEQLDSSVAAALSEQYLPRFSGDSVPSSAIGATLALADRIDTLVGIFAIGQAPTGSSDPFALRRASLAVLRILIEHRIDLDLRAVVRHAAQLYNAVVVSESTEKQVFTYIIERFKSLFEEEGVSTASVQAVMVKQLSSPLDIAQRTYAVNQFSRMPEALALASANKRVANILDKQAASVASAGIVEHLLSLPEEVNLARLLADLGEQTRGLVDRRQYTEVLTGLAVLREPVDAFFDNVMVMVDDEAVRGNRLALLKKLRDLFLEVADIAVLAPAK